MAFDWTGFAEDIGKQVLSIQSGIQQRADEKRAEARQLHMAREMQDISLEGLSKQLDIQEPFKDKADARLLERSRTLANEADQRQRAFAEWSEDRNKKLSMFAGSTGWTEAIKRARAGKDLSEVEIMKMEENILEVIAGKIIDPSAFEALKPFDRIPIMEILNESNDEIRKHQEVMSQNALATSRLEELMSYRKRQERIAAEREERLGVSAEQMSIKRWAEMKGKLDTAVEKAATTFDKYRTELLTELEGNDKINVKGEAFATIGGRKKVKLIDPDTGEVNKEAMEKFVKAYPRYRGRFRRLTELREHVKTRNERRDEFFGGEPAGKPIEEVSEEGIPAGWIENMMKEEGLTREQAIAAYKRFKRKK